MDLERTWPWDAETKVRAQGLLHSLKSSQHIVAFIVAKNVLKPLAVKLQKKDQDIVHAYNMIDNCINNLKQLQTKMDHEFSDWFVDANRLASKVETIIEIPCICKRQTRRANAITENSSTEDYYRINIAIPFVDHVVQEMSTRFHPDNRVGCDPFILVPAVCVVEKHLRGLSERLLFWEQDLPAPSSLLSELKLWQQFWMQKAQHDIPSNISDTLTLTDEDVFPNIRVLLIIGSTLPISSCEAERSFSGLQRIKTYLRSSMTTERLAGLALLHLHNDVPIDMDEVCQLFVTKNNRRLFQSCILYD